MTEDLGATYPSLMPFYLYGTNAHMHLDHVITVVPNVQLSAGDIHCQFDRELSNEDLQQGLIVVADNVHEASMQPFPLMKDLKIDANFFFNTGKVLCVTVYKDPYPASTMDPFPMEGVKEVVTKGTITLVGNLYVDTDALNVASEPSADAPALHDRSGNMSASSIESWGHAVSQIHSKLITVPIHK